MLIGLYVYCLIDFVWAGLLVGLLWLVCWWVCWVLVVFGSFRLGLIWF